MSKQKGDGLTRYLERNPGLSLGERGVRVWAPSIVLQPEQLEGRTYRLEVAPV